MKVLIVEDEDLASKRLQKILEEYDESIEIAAMTDSISSTVEWLQNNEAPDLILMDIELLDGQSFEIYKHHPITSPVIFITSYNEFALKAFKVNSIDYLLKPIQKTDLENALQKFESLRHQYSIQGSKHQEVEQLLKDLYQKLQQKEYRRRFLVKQVNKLLTIEIEKIAYFFSDGRLNFFKTTDNEKFIVDYTMDELENMLDPTQYFRISRAFFISASCIGQIKEHPGNRLCLDLVPNIPKDVIVSREKVTNFKRWIGK